MAYSEPRFATTDARWLRLLVRVLVLMIISALVVVLLRGARDGLAEGERMALDMAERNLKNVVWLEAQRTIANEGVAALESRAGKDPRAWMRPLNANEGGAPTEAMAEFVEARWSFDEKRGELVYRADWLPAGDRRWRVELVRDGDGKPPLGLARDLLLVRVGPSSAPPIRAESP